LVTLAAGFFSCDEIVRGLVWPNRGKCGAAGDLVGWNLRNVR